jgi:hypothetical protein
MTQFTLDHSSALLPLVRTIADEIVERRGEKHRLGRIRDELESVPTPEGLTRSLADLAARIFEHDTGLRRAVGEIEALGLSLLRLNPLTIHFPGRTRTGDVVFCWQEGEESLCHGHALGEEEEPRRPLKVRVVDAPKG